MKIAFLVTQGALLELEWLDLGYHVLINFKRCGTDSKIKSIIVSSLPA